MSPEPQTNPLDLAFVYRSNVYCDGTVVMGEERLRRVFVSLGAGKQETTVWLATQSLGSVS